MILITPRSIRCYLIGSVESEDDGLRRECKITKVSCKNDETFLLSSPSLFHRVSMFVFMMSMRVWGGRVEGIVNVGASGHQ